MEKHFYWTMYISPATYLTDTHGHTDRLKQHMSHAIAMSQHS